MKKLLKSALSFLLLPVLLFTACKKSELPAINLSRYLKDSISVTRYGISEATSDTLSLITQKKADKDLLSKYQKFELTADSVWMYKMYIEKITFYVYCNESSEYQMTINVKMTDLASEEDILNSKTESADTTTIEEQVTITPKAKKAVKCTVKIGKTVVNALGSSISIDLDNSPELFSNTDDETESNFMWLIYGFEIHGESRTYSK